ncbi:MAG: PQQ-binding-like beta-propeller repeat protein, partial [Lentisphaeria bacterium]|nr:PQQ-binding-like beta-propeller repeat protein [Lentisphaeria bacterium]
CASTCTDECDYEFQHVCDGLGAYRVCADNDADSCWDLGDAIPCGYGEECNVNSGDCEVVCTDLCALTDPVRCSADNSAVESCGADYDGDVCKEWGVLQSCGAGTSCYLGACISDDPPFTVLISEFLYDAESTNDGDYEFVELWGPAGSSLNGYSLVGVNGANGDVYLTIDLSGATLSSDTLGHLLIAQGDSLIEGADVTWASPDLQNGEDDAIQVRWRGQVIVDAVAYDPNNGCSYGEGDLAPSGDYSNTLEQMYCLGRQWDNNNDTYRDSDDNFTDFWKRSYCTPGWEGWMYRYGVYNTYSTGEYVDSTPAVDTATGNIYVASYDYFDAVGPDFSMLWYVSLSGFKSSPALSPDGSQVYLGVVDGGLNAFDTSNGDVVWSSPSGGRSSPAVDSAGNIYVGTRAPSFAAITSDGSMIWEAPESAWVDSSPALAPVGPDGSMVVVYGVGGVGSGAIVARNISTGAEVWRVVAGGGCNSSPAIGSDGSVYVACDDGVLHSVNGADGTENWAVVVSSDTGGSTELIKGRSPVVKTDVDRDWILMTGAGNDQNFTIVDSLNGDLRDDYNYGEALSSMTALADGGFALVWGDGNQHMLDIWGPGFDSFEWYDELGVYDPDAWIVGSVNVEYLSAYDLGLLYVATAEGMLYGYYLPVGLFSSAGSFPK